MFEDHVFYSRDNSTLSSERKAVLMQNLISAMKGSMGGVDPGSTQMRWIRFRWRMDAILLSGS